MSLSKYYQNSNGFEPDVIVKKIVDGDFIKDRQLTTPLSPFQKEELAQPPSTENGSGLSNNATAGKPDPTHSTGTQASRQSETAPPPSQQAETSPASVQAPDPELYIEKELASKLQEEAYNNGVQEGLKKAEEDFGSATESLLTICQQLDIVRETIISNSGKEFQDFAFAIAERILRISLLEQDKTIIATLNEALLRAIKSEEFTVFIHPDDYNTVSAKATELIAGISGLNHIVIKEDITVDRGGCRLESDNCTIDATVASQFESIRQEMQKMLK